MMWLFVSFYAFVLVCFFSKNAHAANDNSVFILAVGTPNNTITLPTKCDATFWLSTGEQINPPKTAQDIIKSSTGSLILGTDEWWWEDINGKKISKNDERLTVGYTKENRWDPWNLYNGIHYYLTIPEISESDIGDYKFVVDYFDEQENKKIRRSEVFHLQLANENVYCPNPISFGARPGGEILRPKSSAWSEGHTDFVTDNILMVGPFSPTSGNARERFQITSLDINGREVIEEGNCKRFGFNFKVQIFDVDEVDKTATVVSQQDLVVPWDAYKSKIKCSGDCDKARFIGDYATGVQNDNWNHLEIPVWYARGPLFIEKGQYVGISTQGCLQFLKGNKDMFSNVPGQKAYYIKTGTKEWKYGYAGSEQAYYTAYPAPLGETMTNLQEAVGPWSFTFNAKFYDIKPLPPKEEIIPIEDDNTLWLYALIALGALLLLCCCLCCCLASNAHRRTQERRKFMKAMLGQSVNISSETGEPLPPNWFEEKSPSGVPYYYNPVTNESMWDIPCFG